MKQKDQPLPIAYLDQAVQIAAGHSSSGNTRISDIEPLSGLTGLTGLAREINQISDISPLVENAAIGSGDDVDITNNELDCEDQDTMSDIRTLEDRVPTLKHDCE